MDKPGSMSAGAPGGSPLDLLDLLETPLAFAALDGTIEIANRAFRAWTASDATALGALLGVELPLILDGIAGGKRHVIKASVRGPRGRAMQIEYQLALAVHRGAEMIVVEGRDLSRVHEKEAMLQSFAKTIEVNNRLLTRQKAENEALFDDAKVAHAAVQRLLDAADQGFVTIDRAAKLLPGRSAAFDRWFACPPVGTGFAECLHKLSPEVAVLFGLFWAQVEEDVLPLELGLDMLPSELRSIGRSYRLSYKPELDAAGVLVRTLVVISDVTDEVERHRAEAQQSELMTLLGRFSNDRAGFLAFVAEADALVATVHTPGTSRVELLRALHTLKGNCGLFGAQAIATHCHALEDRLAEGEEPRELECRALAEDWRALRGRIGGFLDHSGGGVWIPRDEMDDLHRRLGSMSPADVGRTLETWTWESASRRLSRLGAQVRELAVRLDRAPVDVAVDGGGLRFDPVHWSPFWSSLVHLVLNAVDHGLEPATQRAALGKAACAQVSLRTRIDRAHVMIEIGDDGRGIDWPAVARAAGERGLDSGSPEALVRALFVDGLSTRTQVGRQSGRGVGLAAVRAACDRLDGTIEVDSEQGCGTMFRFRFPAIGVAAALDGSGGSA